MCQVSRQGLVPLLAAAAIVGSTKLPVAASAKRLNVDTLSPALWQAPPGIVIGLQLNAPRLLPATKLFEDLMPYDFHLNPMPVLARSWEIGKDGLVWATHLRVKVRCHDGEPFTAVEASDEMAVLLTLEAPDVRLPCSVDAIGAPAMPGHVYRGTASRNTPANHLPIGTGPFKVPVWPAGEFIHLVRNDDCWQDGKPHFDEIHYRFSPHDLKVTPQICGRAAVMHQEPIVELGSSAAAR